MYDCNRLLLAEPVVNGAHIAFDVHRQQPHGMAAEAVFRLWGTKLLQVERKAKFICASFRKVSNKNGFSFNIL